MKLYSERHNLRKTFESIENITWKEYKLLFKCCEKYFDNLIWLCPEPKNLMGFVNLDIRQLSYIVKVRIPEIYVNSEGIIDKPINKKTFNKYALIDLIEYVSENFKDIRRENAIMPNIQLLNSNHNVKNFQNDINNIFKGFGLPYILKTNNQVERTINNTVLTSEIENNISAINEKGTKDLLEEAIKLFKQPHPSARRDAVEKMWDALERLKTYYTDLDKKQSAEKIVNDMATGQAEFVELFNTEFRALTDMGNKFRIRHHETNTTEIKDDRHYDYFFNRCLSLVALAIQYLK